MEGLRTSTNVHTGVNVNLRYDFGTWTFNRNVDRLVRIGRAKRRAMYRALKEMK